MRKFLDYWGHAIVAALQQTPKFVGQKWRSLFASILAIAIELLLLWLRSPADAQEEWYKTWNVLYFFLWFFLGVFVWELLRYPINQEERVRGGLDKELNQANSELEQIKRQLYDRQHIIEGSNSLSPLIEEGYGAHKNKRIDPSQFREGWRSRVLEILDKYFPESRGEFETAYLKYNSMATRDMLEDELGKLRSIQVTVRTRVDKK